MKAVRPILLLLFLSVAFASGQQLASTDAQAMVAKSVATMGGGVPPATTAKGRVELVIGSYQTTGSVRILTRGLHQTREIFDVGDHTWELVYSRGMAAEVAEGSVKSRSLELGASGQSFAFPLPMLAAALADGRTVFEYVAAEPLGAFQAHHLRLRQSEEAASAPKHLAEFSTRDLWLDTRTYLPLKLAVTRRSGAGATSATLIETFYNDFRTLEGGARYPFLLKQSVNGTPWATIWIDQAAPASTVSDSDFAAAGDPQ